MPKAKGQERTEPATPKRLQQAREQGQIARSKELTSASVLIIGSITLILFGKILANELFVIMSRLFTLNHEEVFDFSKLGYIALTSLANLFSQLILILIILFFTAFISSISVGGIIFSVQATIPKLSKINPLNGFQRMIGLQSWIELIKAILKVLLISGTAFYLIYISKSDLFQLSIDIFPQNIFHSIDILLNFILIISCSLLAIVIIDIPFQIWQHSNQLKMTKQEVKDEQKEIDGKPEIKGRIRKIQREIAQRRMMTDIQEADVIIINPEHFSVAIRYKPNKDKAPIVLAKGIDYMAFKIQEAARKHDIHIILVPELARSLYYSTKLGQEIPDGLFMAIAQILAYIFQLKQYQKYGGEQPILHKENIKIPQNLKY
ncbi:flagellar biosynthetic protein [Candidatus Photodesmus katoptron]|uniref:flagellar biosynthesis protein FlhB n=1 Tax=Candidatus Photodesmus anomalopis TaxID=28176 RepID=UPI0004D50F9E|nr:flagellar biosynthesis protein FlhB [Candidatus Photodesmus katoptron]KEY90368.1 flagellar biosynthetic protein [Candidatus Photodesmus katoptron]